MVEVKQDGTHYLADHASGNLIEVWWTDEPELVGWVGRLTEKGHIQPLNTGEFTIISKKEAYNG